MTYAGLKSMLYAGVGKDDPRVKGAVSWIRKHYDLDTNPGLDGQGLYYYYHVFAKALGRFGRRHVRRRGRQEGTIGGKNWPPPWRNGNRPTAPG